MTISSVFLALVALAAVVAVPAFLLLRARQLVADGDLAFAVVGGCGGSPRASGSSAPRGPPGSNLSRSAVMRLKSNSAESCTRARPGPTTEETIDFDLVAQAPLEATLALVGAEAADRRRSSSAPSASSWPASSTIETRCGFNPLTAEATRWRIARTCCGFERAAHAQHDRGRRLDLVAREQRALGQDEMHARGLHPVDRPDGARKLAFERAQVIDVLHEGGGAERVGLVEDLVADAAALGQAALGELHAQARHLVVRHHDRWRRHSSFRKGWPGARGP